MIHLQSQDLVKCPCCGREQEEPPEDFVIPGKLGHESISEIDCIWCDELFGVEKVSATEFLVHKLNQED